MRKILLFIVSCILFISLSFASNICDGNITKSLNCALQNVKAGKNVSWTYSMMWMSVKYSIKFNGDFIVYDTTNVSQKVINSCKIKLSDKSKLENVLEKNSKWSFSSSDMEFADCKIIMWNKKSGK